MLTLKTRYDAIDGPQIQESNTGANILYHGRDVVSVSITVHMLQ